MHGIQKLNLRVVLCQGSQRSADAAKRFAKMLSTVSRHQHQALARVKLKAQLRSQGGRREQRINHGIAGDKNVRAADALFQQVLPGTSSRCEVPRAN